MHKRHNFRFTCIFVYLSEGSWYIALELLELR